MLEGRTCIGGAFISRELPSILDSMDQRGGAMLGAFYIATDLLHHQPVFEVRCCMDWVADS